MKHTASKTLVALPVLAFAALAPTQASASIVGSSHDFSTQLRFRASGEVCVFCHTPHRLATDSSQIAPLWNRATTMASFTLYSSASLNATPGQPDSNSKACLSCHDGTVAIDTFGGRTGMTIISGSRLLSTDLSNDHPVSFTYDAALATADGGLVTPASASAVSPGIPLFAGKLQCSSCHQVHDNSTHPPFLRADRAGSQLCLRCHTK
jgi:predicted CXXCH cytochrome family protein